MAWYTELTSEDHALKCIKNIFGHIDGAEDYAKMAWLLTEKTQFTDELLKLSSDMWDAYLSIDEGGHRLTRAIQSVSRDYGFTTHVSHVVDIDVVDETTFF